jgi:chemotaxis methyl-accepting protein methylase
MTLMDSLRYPRAWEIEILTTDISKETVTIASTGFYEANILKKIPVFYQKKYMKSVNNGAVVVNELFEKISFRIFNLCNLTPREGDTCMFIQLDGSGECLDLFNTTATNFLTRLFLRDLI